jgi:hypothetical protein
LTEEEKEKIKQKILKLEKERKIIEKNREK